MLDSHQVFARRRSFWVFDVVFVAPEEAPRLDVQMSVGDNNHSRVGRQASSFSWLPAGISSANCFRFDLLDDIRSTTHLVAGFTARFFASLDGKVVTSCELMVPAWTHRFAGEVTELTDTYARGWALDVCEPDNPVLLDVFASGRKISSAPANCYARDGGAGVCNRGFFVNLSRVWSAAPDDAQFVEVRLPNGKPCRLGQLLRPQYSSSAAANAFRLSFERSPVYHTVR